MRLLPSTKIYLSDSHIPHSGRGVFAREEIKKGELIECCPIILLPENHVPFIRKTELHNYYFMWGDDEVRHKAGICLGFGSLYNHSYKPNATYKKLLTEKLIEFVALQDIKIDEEITVNYNHGNPDDTSPLWMKSVPHAEGGER